MTPRFAFPQPRHPWGDGLHAVEVPSGSAVAATTARRIGIAALLYTVAVLAITLLGHPTPLYFVETDLVGEYFPAADALARGAIDPRHHAFKGPGYPAMLALATWACGGDAFLAARIVSAVATGAAAAFAGLLVARIAGPALAFFTLFALMLNPTFLRYGIEAGTDAPATALMLAATWAALSAASPGRVALAGLLAGLAAVTRWNAAFLIPLGLACVWAARRPRPWAGLALYAGLAALPALAWSALCLWSTGHLIADRNYLNVAYELYGRDLPWSVFETRIGSRFDSLLGVLAYDPLHAAGRIAWNLVVHLGRDLTELVPPWIGVLAAPGLVLAARRPAWRPALLHAAACALVLAPVFYSTRFSLYLLPFLLAAAGLSLHALATAWGRRLPGPVPARNGWALVAIAALAGSGFVAARDLARHLAESPEETRAAGAWLRARGLAGESLMARKPHAAWFAGMEHRPLPAASSVLGLHRRARAEGIRHLLVSPIEVSQRRELAPLGDSAVALPGFEPLHWGALGEGRWYALYRITDVAVDSTAMARALERAVLRYADRRPREATAQAYAAMHLLDLGRGRQAIARLEKLERAGARDPMVSELLSNAWLDLGDLSRAERKCREAMALTPPTAWHHARLAQIAERRGDADGARIAYERAVQREPANLVYLERLGLTYIALARYEAAASVFERCIRLAPEEARFRRFAMGAWQYAGDPARARRLYDQGVRAGLSERVLLEDVASSTGTR